MYTNFLHAFDGDVNFVWCFSLATLTEVLRGTAMDFERVCAEVADKQKKGKKKRKEDSEFV